MESSIAESLWRQPACELLPTNLQKEEGLAGCGAEQKVLERSGSQANLCVKARGGDLQKHCCFFYSQGKRSKPSSQKHHSDHRSIPNLCRGSP